MQLKRQTLRLDIKFGRHKIETELELSFWIKKRLTAEITKNFSTFVVKLSRKT